MSFSAYPMNYFLPAFLPRAYLNRISNLELYPRISARADLLRTYDNCAIYQQQPDAQLRRCSKPKQRLDNNLLLLLN